MATVGRLDVAGLIVLRIARKRGPGYGRFWATNLARRHFADLRLQRLEQRLDPGLRDIAHDEDEPA